MPFGTRCMTTSDEVGRAQRIWRRPVPAPCDDPLMSALGRFAAVSATLALCAVPLAVGTGSASADQARAGTTWDTIGTYTGAKHQACRVLANDGTAWRVRNRLVNGDQAPVGAGMTVLRNGNRTDRTWSSGLVAKNATSPVGSVLVPRGDSRFTLEHSQYQAQSGTGGALGVLAVARC